MDGEYGYQKFFCFPVFLKHEVPKKSFYFLSEKEASKEGRKSLVSFMCSGPVMIQVLEGENAIAHYREIMGATNPKDAKAGTIRADFADSIDENAVHGSDSLETAKQEIKFFFMDDEICKR